MFPCLTFNQVAAIDMATETRFRPVFKFCAELYRSADFFLLKPLLPVVQRYLGDYCDEKTRWIWTRGNITEDERNEKKALVWLDDLKAAILETNKWNTPVINVLLMEFVWASQAPFMSYYPTYLNMREWLRENVKRFCDEMEDRCETTPRPTIWFGLRKPRPTPVWTPPRCKTPVSAAWLRSDICVRCGNKLEKGEWNKQAYGQLRDPFNSPDGCSWPREWCVECAKDVKYPWREDGYL